MLRVNAPIHAQSKAIVPHHTVPYLVEDSRQQVRSVLALSAECQEEQHTDGACSQKE